MTTLHERKTRVFDRKHFVAKLSVIAPRFHAALTTLFESLARFECLDRHPGFLNFPQPIFVDGWPLGSDSQAECLNISLPFSDEQTGLRLQFHLIFAPSGQSIDVTVWKCDNVLEGTVSVHDVVHEKGLNFDGQIDPDVPLSASIDRILSAVSVILTDYMESIVDGTDWP